MQSNIKVFSGDTFKVINNFCCMNFRGISISRFTLSNFRILQHFNFVVCPKYHNLRHFNFAFVLKIVSNRNYKSQDLFSLMKRDIQLYVKYSCINPTYPRFRTNFFHGFFSLGYQASRSVFLIILFMGKSVFLYTFYLHR